MNISFNGIIEFVAVAETHGFSAAARKLGVNVSHISRKVAALEKELGVSLLARSTRTVRLTDAGQAYFARCQELVYGLQEANETVLDKQVELSGVLKVSAAGEFAEQHIAPLLIEFGQLHPKLTIEMDFNSQMVNFVDDAFDFSIRYGPMKDSSLIARKLTNRSLVAAASEHYLDANGTPAHPKDLTSHQCLMTNNSTWFFDNQGKPLEVKLDPRCRSNSVRSVVLACERGLGIAYLPRSSFGNALKGGSVVPVLEPFWNREIATWIVYANRNFLPAKARLAINFLLEKFEHWQE
ncbi:transcriptional regulator, LysR family protein [Paraglaciecola mesophila KMM 241]|uniref:Transcriptional regulator, LysR family protein n=1 Tax=Paraglaciecola mesophila KMM 241 TaxID=1128912 RepID=K6Z8G5_9ALTE|nr:LysR family transcriptional regulator [Paraglaciecola mesophila]GAC26677.1 transcriptional regulator, LysR family protein [Paraglaciecola mesophila KMM 241]